MTSPCNSFRSLKASHAEGKRTHEARAEDQNSRRSAFLSFEVMLDVIDFVLGNTIVKMPDGRLLRQCAGIPMGDPLSPGMCIGSCAWMEDEWMQGLAEADKTCFRAKRYMDDVLLIHAKPTWWDHERFTADFKKSECYHPPLRLEDGTPDTFLETRFELADGRFRYWLKNDNEDGNDRIWRYQHFKSHAPLLQKRALLTACLRKVQRMSSDTAALYRSGLAKAKEFMRLQYPRAVVAAACRYLAASSGERTWLDVRDSL